ncbi:secreted protein C-like [Topomyia yanbarensis]|uniref:secreted protein C-like n=1 Tax=Topomyia yanbarensis TaxID=2498891 RepID=UPI00273B79CE|nr:secreted protein C-like [Topomyia yanbarensis]
MAIPFLQPEEDESARQHGNGLPPAGTGNVSAGTGSGIGAASGSSGNSNANVASANVIVGAPMIAGVAGPIPVPGSPAPSGTTTAIQTPLIAPMNGDQLVQLFYEALYRYSRGDTPSTPISQSPQSTSCSPFTTGYYSGQVFFPQTPNAVQRPLPGAGGRGGGGGVFFGLPTPSPSGSSSHSSQHSANSPDTPSCSSAGPIFHQFPTSFAATSSGSSGSSTSASPASTAAVSSSSSSSWNDEGDESSESDSSPQPSSGAGCSSHCLGLPAHDVSGGGIGGGSSSSSSGTIGLMAVANPGFIPPHLDYMAGREQLQEFAGKIPQRKKKSKANKSKKSRFLEQTLVWPTLAVTATLIALGCGLLAAR